MAENKLLMPMKEPVYALAVSKSTSGLIVSAGHNDNALERLEPGRRQGDELGEDKFNNANFVLWTTTLHESHDKKHMINAYQEQPIVLSFFISIDFSKAKALRHVRELKLSSESREKCDVFEAIKSGTEATKDKMITIEKWINGRFGRVGQHVRRGWGDPERLLAIIWNNSVYFDSDNTVYFNGGSSEYAYLAAGSVLQPLDENDAHGLTAWQSHFYGAFVLLLHWI
ncbi:hypothetical protein Tco_0795931 [Tanacetum coccineum]